MNPTIAQKLIEVNRQFYTHFGAEFSATRQRLQPGVRSILDSLRGDEAVLDLGCGNGELARDLARRSFRGSYHGMDFSIPLLKFASADYSFPVQFTQADLTLEWASQVSNSRFQVIFAFAVLHHIPSVEMRLNLLRAIKDLLADDGKLVVSNWQFLNSEKLRARIQPWNKVDIHDGEVDAGDHLLDWRSGGNGLRYAHHFSTEELSVLADRVGMRIIESFLSDGEGGNLGLYQIWGRG